MMEAGDQKKDSHCGTSETGSLNRNNNLHSIALRVIVKTLTKTTSLPCGYEAGSHSPQYILQNPRLECHPGQTQSRTAPRWPHEADPPAQTKNSKLWIQQNPPPQ